MIWDLIIVATVGRLFAGNPFAQAPTEPKKKKKLLAETLETPH
jgi:hypothetical protein